MKVEAIDPPSGGQEDAALLVKVTAHVYEYLGRGNVMFY